jgi:hypothetical protein
MQSIQSNSGPPESRKLPKELRTRARHCTSGARRWCFKLTSFTIERNPTRTG